MTREEFVNVAEETLDSLPEEFRSRIQNVAILVENYPPKSRSQPGQRRQLLLASFTACQRPKRAYLTCQPGLPTSCSIRKTLRRSARLKQKFAIKFARPSSMNSVIILA